MPEDLTSVMRSATENLYPNVGKLTAGGLERGARKRRNRRISQIAGAAASVTAVFGVVAMVGTPGHGGSANVSAASGPGVPAVAVAPQSSAPHNTTTEAAPGSGKPTAAPVSGAEMADWLQQVLQPYHFTDEKVQMKAGTDDRGGPYAALQVSYAAGTGSITLDIQRSAWSDQNWGSPIPQYNSITELKDGSHLVVYDGPEWPAGNGDPSAKRIDVSWYRNDGIEITAEGLNEATEKGATTASAPALTVAQATQVVQSPVWDKAIASVLAKPSPAVPKVPGDKGDKKPSGSGQSSTPAESPVH